MTPSKLPILLVAALCLSAANNFVSPTNAAAPPPERARLIVLADMGNEPDEEQQMVHLLLYANDIDVEGLIAVTGKYLRQTPQPELFHKLIDGYAKVLKNLQLHASGWPSPEYLHGITKAGQQNYGIADTGQGKASPGSELIVQALLRENARPLWVVVNAGANTLAQALRDLRAKETPERMSQLVAKLRVFENGSQDNSGAWICHEFPDIHWIRSNYQTYCYGGPSGDGAVDNSGGAQELGPYTWQPYAYSGVGQHQWALENIKGNHGPLGALWPIRQFKNGNISFLEGGGTVPWLGLLNKGMFSDDQPSWGSWSGRFSRKKVVNYWSKHADIRVDEEKVAPFSVFKEEPDTWVNPENGDVYADNLFAPVWRWRRAFFNDFVARMEWCVKPYAQANHNPVTAVDGAPPAGIVFRKAQTGQTLTLDASASTDPDQDALDFNWFVYSEAGTYTGKLAVKNAQQAKAGIVIPSGAAGKQIHLILEVRDRNPKVVLYDYRRVVIDVGQ